MYGLRGLKIIRTRFISVSLLPVAMFSIFRFVIDSAIDYYTSNDLLAALLLFQRSGLAEHRKYQRLSHNAIRAIHFSLSLLPLSPHRHISATRIMFFSGAGRNKERAMPSIPSDRAGTQRTEKCNARCDRMHARLSRACRRIGANLRDHLIIPSRAVKRRLTGASRAEHPDSATFGAP